MGTRWLDLITYRVLEVWELTQYRGAVGFWFLPICIFNCGDLAVKGGWVVLDSLVMSSTKHHEACGSFPVRQEDNRPYRDAAFLVTFPSLLPVEGQFETTPVDDIPIMMRWYESCHKWIREEGSTNPNRCHLHPLLNHTNFHPDLIFTLNHHGGTRCNTYRQHDTPRLLKF